MSFVFNLVIYQPLFNLLIFFYNTIAFKDFGLSIVFLTILIRLILYPLTYKMFKHQRVMQRIQGDIKKIQEVHKGDKMKQSEAMMALYKENKVNPFSSILLLLIQIPILIALYKVFNSGLNNYSASLIYPFIGKPESLNTLFLGLINLKNANILIVSLSAIFQFLQSYINIPKTEDKKDPKAMVAKQTAFMMPILTLVLFWRLPAAIGIYWVVTSLFSLIQQIFINKSLKSNGQLQV